MDALTDAFKNYFNFKGRTRRKGFWLFGLFSILGMLLASLTDSLLFLEGARAFNSEEVGPVEQIYILLIVIPTLSVAVRRLHDTNRRGWWLLLPIAPVLVGLGLFIFSTQIAFSTGALIALTLGLLTCYVVQFVFLVLPSDGDNRFGEAPYPAITS